MAENGETLFNTLPSKAQNNFNVTAKNAADFAVRASGLMANVIQVIDGSPTTGKLRASLYINSGFARSDPQRDILKLVVINRYYDARPAVAFVKNFGLKKGAIASSVAHDSHNIICVGVSDEDIKRAVNLVIESGGGIAATCSEFMECLPLPVAGLMSGRDGFEVAKKYRQLGGLAKALGTNLRAPFMTLSFMSLLVIHHLKLSNLALSTLLSSSSCPCSRSRISSYSLPCNLTETPELIYKNLFRFCRRIYRKWTSMTR